MACEMNTWIRALCACLLWFMIASSGLAAVDGSTPIFYIALDVHKAPSRYKGETLDYPEICVTLPEVTNRLNNRLPASNPLSNGLSGPGRIMFRDRNGATRQIWSPSPGRVATPADLRLSPDGNLLAFTIYTGSEWQHECGSENLTVAGVDAGAHIAILDLRTGITNEWPNVRGETHAVTPAIINQGGQLRVMFASDRDQVFEPILPNISPLGYPALQTYVADLDGSNPVRVGPHDMVAAYGFFQLMDGRVVSSSAQWMHDRAYTSDGLLYANSPSTLLNMWEVWATDPWGGSQETLFGAHWNGKAMHFFGQLSDGRICTTEYYRGNYQNGAGNFWCWTPSQEFTIEGIPVAEATTSVANSASAHGALNPRDLLNVTPWARSEDDQSYFDVKHALYQGRVRDPVGLPGGELMFSWCRGTCNNQGGWTPDLMDAYITQGPNPKRPVAISRPLGQSYGIYKLPADHIPSSDYLRDPVMLVDDPDVIEYGAIYGGKYADVYGKSQPETVDQPRSSDGNCYLQVASQLSDTTSYDVAHGRYRFGFNDHSPVHGKEIPGVKNADVRYIRVNEIIPNSRRQRNFAGQGNEPWTVWGYRTATLGDAPVHADGSARIRIPCNTPFVIQGVNDHGEVIKRDMTPQSLRPGTTLSCGGCHLHNDVRRQPRFDASIAAGAPAVDLTHQRLEQPEYLTDIWPIVRRRCAGCHSGSDPAGGVDFGDRDQTRKMLLEDFKQEWNPHPLDVDPPHGVHRLDRPSISWLIDGSFSGRSPFYWYFVGERRDYAHNATWPTDFDYDPRHPKVAALDSEVSLVRRWIDTGALYMPAAIRHVRPTDLIRPVVFSSVVAPKHVASPKIVATPDFLSISDTPVAKGAGWAMFAGSFQHVVQNGLDPHELNLKWAYSRSDPVPDAMRMFVHAHGSSAGRAMSMFTPRNAFAPPMRQAGSIELRTQDAEAVDGKWRQWWGYARDGVPYPSRRIAAALDYLEHRYSQIDFEGRGIVLKGGSMGGGGALFQSLLLPEKWRSKVAYVTIAIGGVLPRLMPRKYAGDWPPDAGITKALWDRIDLDKVSATDRVFRSIHIRHRFSTNDPSFVLADGTNSQMPLVNICEREKISCAMSWISNGHASGEPGVAPMVTEFFDDPAQDVTLDRAYPAITHSTGNFPLTAADRLDIGRHPRGHYNLGISWDHANTVDTSDELVIPIRYQSHKKIGKGIPDQPDGISVDVTPRRIQHFTLQDGAQVLWSWDGGRLTGRAIVTGDTVTATNIPLVSGDVFRAIRFYRRE